MTLSPSDKRTVDQGFLNIAQLIRSEELKDAERKAAGIQVVVNRTKYKAAPLALMRAGIASKMSEWQKCKEFAEKAHSLGSKELQTWIMLLRATRNIEDWTSMMEISMNALTTLEPDKRILTEIGPALVKLADGGLSIKFVEVMKQLRDWKTLGFEAMLPEIHELTEVKFELLVAVADESVDACRELVWLYFNQRKDLQLAWETAMKLPEGDEARLYAETLLGPDPVGSARKYKEVCGSTAFDNFVNAVTSDNMDDVLKVLANEFNFRSGWVYTVMHMEDGPKRELARETALSRFPEAVELVDGKIRDLIRVCNLVEMKKVIAQFESKDVKSDSLNTARILVGFLDYGSDGNREHIRPILDLDDDPNIVHIKAEVVWELRDEISDCAGMFVSLLRANKDSGPVYGFFGKWHLAQGDKEKSDFLFKKAMALGVRDADVIKYGSESLIDSGEWEEALLACRNGTDDKSRLLSSMLLRRLGRHMEACEILQNELRKSPSNLTLLRAIGHSYAVLNRVMSTLEIAEEIANLNPNETDLLWKATQVMGRDVGSGCKDFGISETPIRFYCFMAMSVTKIKQFTVMKRTDTCLEIISSVQKHIEEFAMTWGSLASVHRICGDFGMCAFSATEDHQFIDYAIQCFKARAEKDKRAESFIDLATALHLGGQSEVAVVVLRRVLKAFPQNISLWLNLGVAFALTSKNVFAKHCFNVVIKNGEGADVDIAYVFLAEVSSRVGDEAMMQMALDTARARGGQDGRLLMALTNAGGLKLIMGLDAAYRCGPNPLIIEGLAGAYLAESRVRESFGYASMSGNRRYMSLAWEGLGKYDMALRYADDEETQKRLRVLIGDEASDCALLTGPANKGAIAFAKGSTACDHVAAGMLFAQIGDDVKALSEFDKAREIMPKAAARIDQIMIQTVESASVDLETVTDPKVFFIQTDRYSDDSLHAAYATVQQFPKSKFALTCYVVEGQKCVRDYEQNREVTVRARELYALFPSAKSALLYIGAHINLQQYSEAWDVAQMLCVMRPTYRVQMKALLEKLRVQAHNEKEERRRQESD